MSCLVTSRVWGDLSPTSVHGMIRQLSSVIGPLFLSAKLSRRKLTVKVLDRHLERSDKRTHSALVLPETGEVVRAKREYEPWVLASLWPPWGQWPSCRLGERCLRLAASADSHFSSPCPPPLAHSSSPASARAGPRPTGPSSVVVGV